MHSTDLYLCRKVERDSHNFKCGRRRYEYRELVYAYRIEAAIMFKGVEYEEVRFVTFHKVEWIMHYHELSKNKAIMAEIVKMFTALYEQILDSVDKEVG